MKYTYKKQVADEKSTSGFRIEEIEATPEKWVWGVIYKDGKELKQFADDGTFHRFAEINQKEVETFIMYQLEDMTKRYEIRPDGAQIFHFYRNTVLEAGTENEQRLRTFVFGWKNEAGAVYNYILPGDRIISTPGDSLKIG